MKLLILNLLVATTVLAEKVEVTWRLEKSSGQSSLSVFDPNGTVVAETCGSVIGSDSPIDFSKLDDSATGSFTVDRKSYVVHSDPGQSGGPSCSRIYNPDITMVNCRDIEWSDAADTHQDKELKCFHDEKTSAAFSQLEHHTTVGRRRALMNDIMERQETGSCVSGATTMKLKGDGKFYILEQSEL